MLESWKFVPVYNMNSILVRNLLSFVINGKFNNDNYKKMCALAFSWDFCQVSYCYQTE